MSRTKQHVLKLYSRLNEAPCAACKLLTLATQKGSIPALDLREWYFNWDTGELDSTSRGFSLTDDEAHNLYDALEAYFEGRSLFDEEGQSWLRLPNKQGQKKHPCKR